MTEKTQKRWFWAADL